MTLTSSPETPHTIPLTTLKELHYALNPGITFATKHNIELIFDDLEKIEIPLEEHATSIFDLAIKNDTANRIGQIAMSICNGNKGSFEDIKKLLEEYGNEKKEELGERAVTDSLEELLEDSKYNTRWVFNIKDLKEKVGGVGPAIFIEVAARPEVGKTCFWVSLAASPGGFCWQGAKVLALCNEEKATRVKLRAFSSATGFTHDELATKAEEAKRVYSQIADKLRIYDVVGIHLDDIAALIDKETPDIVVVDQLDKVRIDGEFTSAHQKLRELYLQARELSKKKNNAFFAISQLSADAQDKMYPDYSMLENSKTGKAAEADAIFCLGQSPAINDFTRGISIPKNKITGNHQACHVRIQPEISRFIE